MTSSQIIDFDKTESVYGYLRNLTSGLGEEDKDMDKEEAKSGLDWELWRSLPGWLVYNGGRTTPVYWGDFGLAALANTIPPSPYWPLDPLLCPVALQ